MEIQTPDGLHTFPISVDRTFAARGPLGDSVVEIKNGAAFFASSPCVNQLCVQAGHLHEAGGWAACLPNRIFMRVTGGGESVDVLSQ